MQETRLKLRDEKHEFVIDDELGEIFIYAFGETVYNPTAYRVAMRQLIAEFVELRLELSKLKADS